MTNIWSCAVPAVFLILLWEGNGFSFNYHLNETASCPDTSVKTMFAELYT